MSFDPRFFLEISKEIGKGSTEAHLRSLANRAYYAAFGFIKSKDPSFSSTDMSAHRELSKNLKNTGNIHLGKCGALLETLFKGRLHSDYEYKKEFKSSDCAYSIQWADEIIKNYVLYLESKKEE